MRERAVLYGHLDDRLAGLFDGLLLWLTARRLPKETSEARLARAVAAGEPA